MTDNTNNNTTTNTDKPKRKRRTLEERIAAQEAELAKLRARQNETKLADDPRFSVLNQRRTAANSKLVRAKRTINGQGRGKGAQTRIEQLRAEIADLETRVERDAAVLLVAEDYITQLDAIRDGIIAGEIDAENYELPETPECMRASNYNLTDVERVKELEAKARAEQGRPDPEPNEAPETVEVETTETVES